VKSLALILLAVATLSFGACDSVHSVPANVREKFTGPTYRTKTFPADSRKTYEAAKAALGKINFRFVRGGPAQGQIEALSGLVTSDTLKSTRQLGLDVKLSNAIDGGTTVAVLFNEMVEDDSTNRGGLGVSTSLHDTALYDVYFRYIEEALAAK
jgi:hypothetical protein